MQPRIPKSLPQHGRTRPKPPPAPKHLIWIRSLPCCVYPGAQPVEAHHLLRVQNDDGTKVIKGAARRNHDRWAIPLSKRAHDELHRDGDEEGYLAAHGIDGRSLARTLWKHSGDDEKGLRAVERARAVVRRA